MPEEMELETFFAAARADPPAPSQALLARIADEGRALQPRGRPLVAPVPPRGKGTFRSVLDSIGGWPVLGGLMTAGCAGLWLGLSDAGGLGGYVYAGGSEGWLYGPADLVALAVTEDGV
ncbi:hypothetical protein [Albidovulum sediminis]|uniref:Dihydroorotate dehydrogenase n=1 Tax=Albidovulum sediminis TaxID=3066345 RepID=A0ABT2NKB4_9RHOB|nr:hypothetical protein [Defluviimonas sediminis]MCT8328379.1 hypothetical protein [Defluviimonas sediminis]